MDDVIEIFMSSDNYKMFINLSKIDKVNIPLSFVI